MQVLPFGADTPERVHHSTTDQEGRLKRAPLCSPVSVDYLQVVHLFPAFESFSSIRVDCSYRELALSSFILRGLFGFEYQVSSQYPHSTERLKRAE